MSAKRRFMKRLAGCTAGGTGVRAHGNRPGTPGRCCTVAVEVRITPRTQSLPCGAPASHPDIPGHLSPSSPRCRPRPPRKAAGPVRRAASRRRRHRAAATAGGAGAPGKPLVYEGQTEPPAARRHLVLPPGRRAHAGRHRALVRAARPERLAGDPRAAQLERARHARSTAPRSAGTARSSSCPGPQGRAKRTFWKVRFEGSNYRTKVWLNGKTIGGYTGYFPFEARSRRPAQGAQHAGREGLVGAQQPRPHALAPGRLQRLRHRRLVELRRPAARGLRAQDRHDRHRGRAGPAAPAQGGRPRQGRGARLPAQHDRQGAGRRPGDRRADGRRIRLPGKRIPASSPRLLDQTFTIKQPAAVAARRPGAVPADGDGRGGRARARRATGCASACASSRPRAAG